MKKGKIFLWMLLLCAVFMTVTPTDSVRAAKSSGETAETEKKTEKEKEKSTEAEQEELAEISLTVKQQSEKEITLSWSKVKKTSEYRIYRSVDGGKFKKWKTLEARKLTATITAGKEYVYYVVSFNGKKKIGQSNKVQGYIPQKVTELTATKTGAKKCRLTWGFEGTKTAFIIYRKTGDKKAVKIGESTKCKFTDQTLKDGNVYTYQVVPVYQPKKDKKVDGEKISLHDSQGSAVSRKIVNTTIVDTTHKLYTYNELRTDLSQLKAKYSDYCQLNTLAETADDRQIFEMVLGNPDAKKHLLVFANLHAREYMTIQLCMKQIEYYLDHYNGSFGGRKRADVLNEIAIHYIPSANPDGTAISQKGFGAIRNTKLRQALVKMRGSKYPKLWKANARGIDLNDHWDYHFVDTKKGYGASGYGGKTGGTEPEVRCIVDLMKKIQKQGTLLGAISYHSTGQILYGRCSSDVDKKVSRVTKKMSDLAVKRTGYVLQPAAKSRYSKAKKISDGSSRDYFLYKAKIPEITIEVGSKPCPLPISEFARIWKKNRDLVLEEAMVLLQ